jgi:hypothetical protein
MEKFIEIKIEEILTDNSLNFDNLVEVVNSLMIVIKQKDKKCKNAVIIDLISNACVKHILDKYKCNNLQSFIDELSDSDEENTKINNMQTEYIDTKVKMLDVDIALLDNMIPIIEGVVKTFNNPGKCCF